jgi:hypothetical protein
LDEETQKGIALNTIATTGQRETAPLSQFKEDSSDSSVEITGLQVSLPRPSAGV